MSDDTADQRAQRIHKLDALRQRGADPFAIERFARSHQAAAVTDAALFNSLEGAEVVVAGRIVARRPMGKASFLNVADESGRLQVYVRRDELGDDAYGDLLDLDLGDVVGVAGAVFKTRTGEISVHARKVTLLAKALRPLPLGKVDEEGRAHGALTDKEERYRQRYLDLLANPDARDMLARRSRLVSALRRFLDARGFMEVETPVLQAVAGGATARPFHTHHNALNYDFKLRISLELYLKRLIIGGFEKVYEIGRVFRNEGVSTRHNPEFSLLELYQAYVNLEDVMELVEEMFIAACTEVNGGPTFTAGGHTIDLSSRPWRRLSMLRGIEQYSGIRPEELRELGQAKAAAVRAGARFDVGQETTLGGLIEKLHEHFTQPQLIQPTFITDFPIETSPLAKKRLDDPTLTRRFEIYAATQELGNAFSEINDPQDQRERFEAQVAQSAAGDAEAHPMDEDFLIAMEYGMPPTGGLGVGIDRLAVVLTGAESIRDVILFPLMRPESG